MKSVYPFLADYGKDFGWFRTGGPGFANCVLVAVVVGWLIHNVLVRNRILKMRFIGK